MPDPAPLSVIALNCSLRRSGQGKASSTDKMLGDLLDAFGKLGAAGEVVRVADLDIHPGVSSDEGPGDAWPHLRARILAADVLILGTPIWLGQPSSVAKRVLERMDAFLEETDEKGRMPPAGKVTVAAVVGNEDGAHHCHAEIYQALNDVGWTIPAGAGVYWVGEAMGDKDYADLWAMPKAVRTTIDALASNAAHLARALKAQPSPGV